MALLALWWGYGLFEVCCGIAIARVAGLATGGWLARRVGMAGTWRPDFAAIPSFARAMAPFSVLFILSMVYFRVDVPIVQALAGETATGLYGAAVTLYGALLLLPESALAAIYPRLARACQDSRQGYARATWIVAKVLGIALVPLSLALICLADPIVALAYGGTFAGSAPVLRLLALSLPLHAVNGALGQALQAGGEQRAMVGIIVFAVAAHVVLTTVLVRMFGFPGAAIAMLLSSACVTAGALRAVHLRVSPVRLTARVVIGVLSTAGPLVLVSLVSSSWRPAAALVGLAWLVIGSLRFGVLGAADLDGIRSALAPRPAEAAA
jgi:O-antigen/teichoic acid export membrane protein